MTIENLFSEMIASMNANTVALEAHTAVLVGGISKKKPEVEPRQADEAPKKEAKKAVKQQPPAKKAAKKAALTLDDVKVAFGEYLAVEDREELADRKANVGAILASFKARQVRDLAEEDFDEALALLKEFVDQLDDANGGDDGDDDSDDSLI